MSKKERFNDLCFERKSKSTLITNGSGGFLRVPRHGFERRLLEGVSVSAPEYPALAREGFIKGDMDLERFAADSAGLSACNAAGPSLHILVLTLKCNQSCVYCRATEGYVNAHSDMDKTTALKCVDTAFRSPSRSLAIEFQGGESLINWEVLKAAVLYAKKKNHSAGKDLAISLVTNLCLMDEEKLAFLLREGVGICSSLDGPADIHDRNRSWKGGSSYAKVEYWLKRITELSRRNNGGKDALPSALMTTTRASLSRPEAIVDVYHRMGLGGIFLRPLSPIGYAKTVWDRIGYGPKEFLSFYERAMRRIMRVNEEKGRFVEKNAAIIAKKMLGRKDPNYLDLRSPCGAALGQLAYNWNGDVYTCDEGRMLGARGEDLFKLGNVHKNTYNELIFAPAAKMCAMASCLDNQPRCYRCVYKPYCGVCPVHNYETQGSPWGNMRTSTWCAVQKGIFDYVEGLLSQHRCRKIMESWLR